MASKNAPPVTATPKSELAGTDTLDRGNTNDKLESLEQFRSDATQQIGRAHV